MKIDKKGGDNRMTQPELTALARDTKHQAGDVDVDIVGNWIWVRFQSKPSENTRNWLKEHSYHWNHKRNVWQFAGSPAGGSPASTVEVKHKYGSVTVAAEPTSYADAPLGHTSSAEDEILAGV